MNHFTDLPSKEDKAAYYPEQDSPLPYPFRHEIEKWRKEKLILNEVGVYRQIL